MDRDAREQQGCRVQMPQVVQACVGSCLLTRMSFGISDVTVSGVDRFAPSSRDHITVLGPTPGVACLELFGALADLALAQDGDSHGIDRDDPRPPAPGRPVDALASDQALVSALVATWPVLPGCCR